ncbi:gll3898 [Gloeobacter violaceus PCC 7421]|uniref:Gll3898 protein n=1 Tax=Gloeobacter violaceus (strain ATCC 29082 / PCC 7421) TaxID=251221 RepID=Q7NEI1_GLOVI|nr:gll3898 [Gloeobacter violaceus PCC 7421]
MLFINWVDFVIWIPPEHCHDALVHNAPNSLLATKPERHQLVDIALFYFFEALPCFETKPINSNEVIFRACIAKDFFPGHAFERCQLASNRSKSSTIDLMPTKGLNHL